MWRALTLVLVLSCAAAAQTNEGSIEGIVTDQSHAVVVGTTVQARNVDTSAMFATTTDEQGYFRFLTLPVGTYEITAGHPGFASLIQKDLAVTVGARINLPLTLLLASQTQHVVVSGQTPLVETTRSQVSSTVDERMIGSLPVNGRNYQDFVLLVPGTIPTGGVGPSFGGQVSLNLMQLDGMNDNNALGGQPFLNVPYQFSLEAVREFQVNINSYSAELGRAADGVVSTVTKSGTNDFHGTLFWYYRDKSLNATDLIRKINGQPKDPLHVNQFGAAAGGPILKDKLFFFVAYDGQRRKLENLVLLSPPPGFQLSSIPSVAALQQRALDYLTPRAVSYLQTFNEDVYFARGDWELAPRQRLTARWNSVRYRSDNGRTSGLQNSMEHTGNGPVNNDALAVSLTSTFSDRVVNVARFNYLQNDTEARSNSSNPQAKVYEGGQLVLTIGRFVSDPVSNFFHQFEWGDTVSYSRQSHVFKLGAGLIWSLNTLSNAQNFSGNYVFNSLQSFGSSLAGNALLQPGESYIQAFSGKGTHGATVHPNATEFAVFGQDEWRATPSLTFNFGLRYDVQWIAQPGVRNSALAAVGLDTSFIPQDRNNFAPRLGFAWSPLHSQRLVLRGGYGLFYGWLRGQVTGRSFFQNGITVQLRKFKPGSPFIPSYPNNICGPPDPSGLPPSCAAPIGGTDVIQLISPDYVQPYDPQASFGVEYQLQKDLAISASYLMVRGKHLQRWRDINLPEPDSTSIGIANTSTFLTYDIYGKPRPIIGFDRILAMEGNANSNYHSLAVQVNKRFSRNFQFLGAYTLSKVIDDHPYPFDLTPGNAGLESDQLYEPTNPRADRALGNVDARHRFVLSGIWDLHYADDLRQPAKAILSGWEFSGILAAQSGLPYSGLVNYDLNNDGNAFNEHTPGQPRNTFRFPTTVSLDPRLTRTVPFNERVRMQFIVEAFNVFNRANITGVYTTQYARSTLTADCGIAGTPCLVPQNTGTTAFGSPAATLDPRILQLAVKLLF